MRKTNTLIAISGALALHVTTALAVVITTDISLSPGDTNYDGQPVVVSNCTLTVNGPHGFASLQVISNGVVTHAAAPNGEADNLLSLTIAGDLEVEMLSRIDVSARGYAAQQGPGAGTANPGGWGRGAGHGGVGGTAVNYGGLGGGAYGSVTTPSLWGSGGGGAGGAGGGVASIHVSGTLRLDGALKADGAPSGGCCAQQGGGSGGSLLINAGTLAGNGLITANGGAGGDIGGGGGGGGGRIAFYFMQNSFTGTISAAGGLGFQHGGAGTVYSKSLSESSGHLRVDNAGASGEWTPLTTPEAFELIIGNQAKVRALAPLTSSVLTVQSNGLLSCTAGMDSLTVTVLGNMRIEAGGKVDVSGLGFTAADGAGAGTNSVYGYGSGGGHGGVGGDSVSGGYWGSAPGGGVYDSIVSPSQWGSGGGVNNHNGVSGGSGGGAVVLKVGGSLQVDGALTSDGLVSPNVQYGGGAGGSVWINAGTLTGGGLIAARGGAGGVVAGGGGGGGGRIALYFTQNTFAGTISATGGLGYQNGGAGTVYTKPAADAYGLVLVDNGTNAGVTRLNRGLWPAELVFDLSLNGPVTVKPDAPQTFRNLVLTNGAVVTHDPAQMGFSWTCLGNAWIASNASFDVDGAGYPAATGPGAGRVSVYGYGSGGGHGGVGADSVNGGFSVAPGGGIYGSSSAPVTLASGGGGGAGGSGGGALRLTVNGTLHLDGAFSANGLAGAQNNGSGAGGSIWITADTLAGSGSIRALGGAAAVAGAAGGGGRIAIYTYGATGFDTNQISAAGAAGAGSLVFGYPPPQPSAEIIGPVLRVSWRTGNGANYQLWSTPDFTTWSPYGLVRAGTGGILTQDCPMTNSPGLFFRVQMAN